MRASGCGGLPLEAGRRWGEGETGAPSIDRKRLYGNSNVFGDIADSLGMPESEWADDEELNPSLDAEWLFLRLHVETRSRSR